MAHPGKVIEGDEAHFREMLSYIVEYGLDGIECIYPSHTKSVTDICLSVAEEKKMIITSGSDCHGSFEDTVIGEMKCCMNDRIKEMVE